MPELTPNAPDAGDPRRDAAADLTAKLANARDAGQTGYAAAILARLRSVLVEAYVPFAARAAVRRFGRLPRISDDAMGAAFLGLTEAARNYDPASGVKFATFAAVRIHGELSDLSRVESLSGLHRPKSSRDQPAPAVTPLGPGDDVAAETPEALDSADAFEGLLRGLPARDADVLRWHYRDGAEIEECAERLGVTVSGAFQMRARALARVRENLAARRPA